MIEQMLLSESNLLCSKISLIIQLEKIIKHKVFLTPYSNSRYTATTRRIIDVKGTFVQTRPSGISSVELCQNTNLLLMFLMDVFTLSKNSFLISYELL